MTNEQSVVGEVSCWCHSLVALTEDKIHQEMQVAFRLSLQYLSSVKLP